MSVITFTTKKILSILESWILPLLKKKTLQFYRGAKIYSLKKKVSLKTSETFTTETPS